MKKFKVLTTPIRRKELDFDDWYESTDDELQLKIERFRARRGREFKHEQ